jgi:hypothetical protein
MPTYQTPDPITAVVEVGVGDVRLTAGDRADTVVDVRPADPDNPDDVRAAAEVAVEFADGELRVVGRRPRWFNVRKNSESIVVDIALPTGSATRVNTGLGAVRAEGRLGRCALESAMGDVSVADSDELDVRTGLGQVDVGRVTGTLSLKTGSGAVRVQRVEGSAVVKNSNGDTHVALVQGDLQVNAANGDITVERALAGVTAKSSNGSVRLEEVSAGDVVAETSLGSVEVGVRRGVAAWLDLDSSVGGVQNHLEDTGAPEPGQPTVRIHARNSVGSIVVRHSHLAE